MVNLLRAFFPLPSPAFLCALHARNPAQPPFLFSVVFNIGSRTISPLPRHTSCAKSWLRNLRFRPFLSNNDRKEEARDPAQSLPSSVKMSPSECLMTESSWQRTNSRTFKKPARTRTRRRIFSAAFWNKVDRIIVTFFSLSLFLSTRWTQARERERESVCFREEEEEIVHTLNLKSWSNT